MRRWLGWVVVAVLVVGGIAVLSVYALGTSPVTPPLGPPTLDGGSPAGPDAGRAEDAAGDAGPAEPDGGTAFAPFPAGPLREGTVSFQIVILPVKKGLQRASEIVGRAARAHFPGLKVVSRKEAEVPAPGLAVYELKLEGLAYSELKLLGRDLSDDTQVALTRAKKALVLEFHLPVTPDLASLRKAHTVALAVAMPIQAVLYDAEAREYLSAREFDLRRIRGWGERYPQAPLQISIHAFATRAGQRSITHGMARLGLPDLTLVDHPPELAGAVATVLNLAAQHLLEAGALPEAGKLALRIDGLEEPKVREEMRRLMRGNARGQVAVAAGWLEPGERDPQNRILELYFDAQGQARRGQLEAVLRELFGP